MVKKKSSAAVVVLSTVVIIIAITIYFSSLKSQPPPPPDAVFLVVVDALRADRLSCFGYRGHVTPHIDSLAAKGVTFKSAYSPASWTRPAMGAIMTSHYPTQLGLVERHEEKGKVYKAREKRKQVRTGLVSYKRSLAEILSAAGFVTAAFINQPALHSKSGFERHFSYFYYPAAAGKIIRIKKEKKESNQKQVWGSTKDAFANDRALANKFRQWLEVVSPGPANERDKKIQKKKIFAWLHFLTPHRPYLPPKKYIRKVKGKWLKRMSALYDGEVQAEDEVIGFVLAAIETHVGLGRSLIIFVSDHGEEFGEHGRLEHGHSLHTEVTRVPLIFTAPGLTPGVVVNQHVSTIDILPTILDITGVKMKKRKGGRYRFEGKSLLPLLLKNQPDLPWYPVYSEGMLYGGTERSFISGNYRIMYDKQADRWSLYDIKADPGETKDLAGKMPQRTAAMRKQLVRLYTGILKDFEKLSKKHRAKKSKARRRRDMKALESLGYINQ